MEKNAYEIQQLNEIRHWRWKEPEVNSRSLGLVIEPRNWLVEKVAPRRYIEDALHNEISAAIRKFDTKDVIRNAGVASIADLKSKELELCDKLANEVHNWAIGDAAPASAEPVIMGLLGISIRVPALITLALRTIHKIGACYGFDLYGDSDNLMVLVIMSIAQANSHAEKYEAMSRVREFEFHFTGENLKTIEGKVILNRFRGEDFFWLDSLAKNLGMNMTKRMALAAFPFIRETTGGSVDGWYMNELGWAARRTFQELWLRANKKIADNEPT